MPLTIVKGPRGSGKTAWVVREGILSHRRIPVVTNIRIGHWQRVHVLRLKDRKRVTERVFVTHPPPNVHYIPSEYMTVENLIDTAHVLRKQGKTSFVLAVDEGGLKWDSRHRAQSPERNFWLRFYRVSRHFGFDEVYVIVQVESALDKQIRDLADVVLEMLNLRAAFPTLFGWFPWPFGIAKRRFNGLDFKGFRWPFYIVTPLTLHRYDHRQFAEEFRSELEEFRVILAAKQKPSAA